MRTSTKVHSKGVNFTEAFHRKIFAFCVEVGERSCPEAGRAPFCGARPDGDVRSIHSENYQGRDQ